MKLMCVWSLDSARVFDAGDLGKFQVVFNKENWLLLDEQLGLPFFIGGGMILLSILAVSLPASAKNRAVQLKKGGSA